MHLVVAGMSHKTAPVEIREKLALSDTQTHEALSALLAQQYLNEAVILSTCNRLEVYGVAIDSNGAKHEIGQFLGAMHELPAKQVLDHLYFHDSLHAIHHLFRVVSSLDSMVVGEAQILGQVRDAYDLAYETDATSVILNRLFRQALSVGKRVRTETEIGDSAVSVSYAAVALAKKIFEDLEGRGVLIVGAGEMSELTVRHLVASGVDSVYVANRTRARAEELAKEFHGEAVSFNNLEDALVKADIIISSTGSPKHILNRTAVAQAMQRRRNRPLFLIDIAVPRDIDPKVNKVYNAFLYNIDDLESVVEANIKERKVEAKRAETIIEHEVDGFVDWLCTLEVIPTISALKDRAEDIRNQELQKVLSRLGNLSEKEVEVVRAMTGVIINRLLHEPVIRLKQCSRSKDGYLYVESLRHLFDLPQHASDKPITRPVPSSDETPKPAPSKKAAPES